MKVRRPLFLTLTGPVLAAIPKDIVERTAIVIEEGFVDAARGREIAAALRQRKFEGEARALADALTKAIQKIESDAHLNVRFNALAPGRTAGSADVSASKGAMLSSRTIARVSSSTRTSLFSQMDCVAIRTRRLRGAINVFRADLQAFREELHAARADVDGDAAVVRGCPAAVHRAAGGSRAAAARANV